MRRKTLILGLTSLAVAAVLVYGIGSDRSPRTVEPRLGEANEAPQTSSVDSELNESTEVEPQRSLGGDQRPAGTESTRKYSSVDEAISRKEIREESTRDIHRVYPFLLKGLDLTASEKDALLSFLIEDLIAKTRTRYASGVGMDEHERSKRIAVIIGDSKLQQFLALERNLSSYRDVGRVGLVFQQNGAPLSDAQQDGMLKIFIDVRDQLEWTLPADVQRGSIESLEYRLTHEDDYDRFVMELAPSVLSPQQVQYLFERYHALSYRRARALEIQRKARADNPSEDLPLGWYPSRGY